MSCGADSCGPVPAAAGTAGGCPAGYKDHAPGYWANALPDSNKTQPRTTVDGCAARCSKDPQCVAFEVYDPAALQQCHLFDKVLAEPFIPNPDMRTCVKTKSVSADRAGGAAAAAVDVLVENRGRSCYGYGMEIPTTGIDRWVKADGQVRWLSPSLPFFELRLLFRCPSTALPLPFHCLFLTFRRLSLTLSLAFHCLFLDFPLPFHCPLKPAFPPPPGPAGLADLPTRGDGERQRCARAPLEVQGTACRPRPPTVFFSLKDLSRCRTTFCLAALQQGHCQCNAAGAGVLSREPDDHAGLPPQHSTRTLCRDLILSGGGGFRVCRGA